MFLQVSVILFTGGGGGVVSQHALQLSRPTAREEVEGSGFGGGGSPGPHSGGKLEGSGLGRSPGPHRGDLRSTPKGGVYRPHPGVSQHALRQTRPNQTATAVGGTHPTGMHSC